ncbi:methionine aminopeptidase, type I family protein [Cryptosporidium muris RN66]|uniref:Methionine aminopeptidase n=1 Tax=Cryptosporidium muris (strain RN66) TaxID=441375 RepID=B6AI34_CRYMR|nr:methionine aminopeptidase, type I family protein [Cryptosporidium muris RN66]EEA07875.1 methionine aminopeptidase, type I family protein [Cryptosporidium muris RN66]|eukprot:XP_002142224.1 methionine aminopeptidase, type I family protein [Cryptosporidium muris RN66]
MTNGQKSHVCEGCNRNLLTSLACPQCIKLDLKPSYFCSQACFRQNWPIHKLKHAIKPVDTDKVVTNREVVNTNIGVDDNLLNQSINPKDPRTWIYCPHIKKFANYVGFTGDLRPYPLSPLRKVPNYIVKPDYADDIQGRPFSEIKKKRDVKIDIVTPEQINALRKCCLIGREALDLAATMIKPGVTTDSIDEAIHNFIISKGGYPSPLNYWNFPKSCCTSVNEVICHGIPDYRPLEEGDIVNVDITVYYEGVHGDLNETFPVGKIDESSINLLRTAYKCLDEAIKICKPGTLYRDIGRVINRITDKNNMSVVRTYCGHGIGTLFHCNPNVPHYKNNKAIGVMKAGHVFTIEPMINLGRCEDITWPDNWTAVTIDGKRSAQFEHTLLITDTGVEVLTKRLLSSPKLAFLNF